MARLGWCVVGWCVCSVGLTAGDAGPIDRKALVDRHAVTLTSIDPHAAVMVGNGELAMSVDITGLQGLRASYGPHSPLMTQAQWAWHSFPSSVPYTLDDAMRPIEAGGREDRYPYLRDWAEAEANPAVGWLRENPHRYALGRLRFMLTGEGGDRPLTAEDVEAPRQTLDLWTGTARSRFAVGGEPVHVATSVHPEQDLILVEVRSSLLVAGQLGVDLDFPYVAATLNPEPADWSSPGRHETTVRTEGDALWIVRTLDEATYAARLAVDGAEVVRSGPHRLAVRASGASVVTIALAYAPDEASLPAAVPFGDVARLAEAAWTAFWETGGVIDLSGTDDPRAREIERRIVLSQYLTRVNGATTLIPQEEGLYSNSWNGKFHHEMHWWHAAHFALWGHQDVLAGSLGWYRATLPEARARAAHYGREGAWWPKMTGVDARESPSTINPFIMWQQPHPIALAELVYRAAPSDASLRDNAEIVFATADLLASFPRGDDGTEHLGPPIIPVQEHWPAARTRDPAFELAYWAYGLRTAIAWKQRLGEPVPAAWTEALATLAPLPTADGLYLPVAGAAGFWEEIDDPACANGLGKTGGAEEPGPPPEPSCHNRDHPSFLMATGMIPGADIDADTMRRTLDATDKLWDFRQTWGWDFPMMAMTAARLGQPDRAVDYLLMDAANNQWGVTGMTPRFHVGADGWVRDADTYFPSNGALLAAAALMAAGWDGAERETPGFPEDWTVRQEGLKTLP